jgi:serine protease AprX
MAGPALRTGSSSSRHPVRLRFVIAVAASVAALSTIAEVTPSSAVATPTTSSYIVSGLSGTAVTLVLEAVNLVGGTLVQALGVANAVEATLTLPEVDLLEVIPGIEVTPNISISLLSAGFGAAPNQTPTPAYALQSGATQLWSKGDTGQGVNVAVLDTGIELLPDFSGRLLGGVDLSGGNSPFVDAFGHGTFVAGLIAASGSTSLGQYKGEAPGAGLVSVKVAGASGSTTLATIIQGVGWTIANAAALHIRVLNMSLGFQPFQPSAIDPLDQAVQAAWNAGIVVVTSAGNAGPFNGTILSPGDDPFVITAGALNDNGSASAANDTIPSFSSAGPTDPDGFFKPDLVASGKSVVSLADPGSTIYKDYPSALVGASHFVGSGTSFSAAITSGAVALDLELHPTDTPNEVKARFLATASPGPTGNPFVEGHGELNVGAAVADNGVQLRQSYGQLSSSGSMDGTLTILPASPIEAGYALAMPGTHASATVQVVDAAVTIPVSCTRTGATAGDITVNLTEGPNTDPANSSAMVPTASTSSASGFQGMTLAPAMCGLGLMYDTGGAQLTGDVISTDPLDALNVQFHYLDALDLGALAAWSTASQVSPLDPITAGSSVNLSVPWSMSSWNAANWTGLSAPSLSGTPASVSGLGWNGSAWNGSAWNGSAWNGSAWNGSAWNGSAWNGSAWNGSAWNGSAWNGSAWNGSAWNGGSWG